MASFERLALRAAASWKIVLSRRNPTESPEACDATESQPRDLHGSSPCSRRTISSDVPRGLTEPELFVTQKKSSGLPSQNIDPKTHISRCEPRHKWRRLKSSRCAAASWKIVPSRRNPTESLQRHEISAQRFAAKQCGVRAHRERLARTYRVNSLSRSCSRRKTKAIACEHTT